MNLLMEGETRKRKKAMIEEEYDEDEDIKMEKFFALIRSAKDIRDQLLDGEGSNTRPPKKVSTLTTSDIVAQKKPAEVITTQRVTKKPPPPPFTADKTPVTVPDFINGGGSGGVRVCRSEGQNSNNNNSNKEGGDLSNNDNNCHNNNSYQKGRFYLDLNLSL